MKKLYQTASIAALLMAASAAPSYAQTAAAPAPAAPATKPADAPAATAPHLEEIVVTAQRRSEQLQGVPIAITALTANALAKSGVNDTQSLVSVTPGLQLNQVRMAVVPFLRGVGTLNTTPGDEGATALYVDGILNPVAGANVFALNNVERVEVLRGPQGTLFGRNAVGGLINVITKDPSEKPGGNVELGYGNYNTFTGSAYVTGAIAKDVAADIALYENYQGNGWGQDKTLGVAANLNREFAVRSKVLARLGSDTKVTFSGDYNRSTNDIGSTRQAIPGAIVTGGFKFSGSIYDTFGELAPLDRKTQYGGSMKIEQVIGDFKLQSTTAARSYDILSNLDSDGYALNTTEIITHEQTTTFQQEFLLSGSIGKLDLTTGFFYFNSDAKYRPFTTTSSIRPTLDTIIQDEQKTNSYAGFLQGTYHVTDSTRLTAGLRYTQDNRVLNGTQYSLPGNPAGAGVLLATSATLPTSQTNRDFSKLTWRGAIDQKLTDNIMAFASVSRGFKSGVFALTSPFSPAVNPETLDAYEIGIKTELFDRRLRLNISGYHYIYQNIQLSSLSASNAPLLLNAAAGRINGADVDALYAVPTSVGRLQLRAGASYLDAIYTDFPAAAVYTPLSAGGDQPSVRNVSGNRFLDSPKFTSSLGFDYDVPVGDVGTLGLTTTWSHNSGFFWDVGNRLQQPAFDLVNGQVSFESPDGRWRVRLYGKNIFDKKYYVYVSAGSFGDTGAAAAPRTFGVAVNRTF